jgi:hypothetical protein
MGPTSSSLEGKVAVVTCSAEEKGAGCDCADFFALIF